MASSPEEGRSPSTPQSIPLQTLSRPPGFNDSSNTPGTRHSRNLSGRGRNLLRNRQSVSGKDTFGQRYERLEEHSPTPTERHTALPQLRLTTPAVSIPSPVGSEADDVSPLDREGFQAALPFAGLSFTHGASTSRSHTEDPYLWGTESHGFGHGARPVLGPYREMSESSVNVLSPLDSDTLPLTDSRFLQPISGTAQLSPDGATDSRSSFQSVRFEGTGTRLGDDLDNTGMGRSDGSDRGRTGSTSPRERSLSPSMAGSPFSRAGDVVRKMSQRVVNISNEPNVIPQTPKRDDRLSDARMDGPPSLPAMMDFGDDSGTPRSPFEKPLEPPFPSPRRSADHGSRNPLKGKSLGFIGPENKLRLFLCDVLVHPWTEPIILALIMAQTVLLAVDTRRSVYTHPRPPRWGYSKADYAFLGLFAVYTLEILARIVVSGFILNAAEYSTIDRSLGFRYAISEKGRNFLALHKEPIKKKIPSMLGNQHPSIFRSFTGNFQMEHDQPGHSQWQQRQRLARRAFLRHSFNRLDMVAVVSYWISFVLACFGVEATKHLYIFQMMSSLRVLRLLGLTQGTAVILRSLKRAAPTLLNVAFLIGFFWLLFAIVGVQSFKSSLRRNCVWVDPTGNQPNYTNTGDFQFCGGYLDNVTGAELPWILPDGSNGTSTHKGYLCPQNSFCVQTENPYNGTVSFDNILQSLELVFVIMSSNTFSDLLYYTTDSDYLAAALFFAAGIVVMYLWLANLLIAVITSSFQVIREESAKSAFANDDSNRLVLHEEEPRKASGLQRYYDRSKWIWTALIMYDLLVQACRSASMSHSRETFIDRSETAVTIILLVEIIVRFVANWRGFFKKVRNCVDLALAIVTVIIQIPPIHNSGQPYAWLTIFQILRIYRVVMAIPLTRNLITTVLGNVKGVLNLIIFVFLLTFLAAIFAVQMFRGEIPAVDINGNTVEVTFFTIYNAFLGMYQIFSSENWTTLVYNVTQYNVQWGTSWMGATFFVIWFILANLIVLNMFIAVIQENFDISEDEKRLQQVRGFLQRKELGGSDHGNLSLATIFRLGRDSRRRDALDYGGAQLEMLLKDAVVRDFLDDEVEPTDPKTADATVRPETPALEPQRSFLSFVKEKFKGLVSDKEPNPFYSRMRSSRAFDDVDPRNLALEVMAATEARKKAQREYLLKHPKYNVSLYIFKPSNPIRQFCQSIVGPGRGPRRFEGVEPVKWVWFGFSAFIYAAVVAMVLLACVTTPLQQKEYFETHGESPQNWFNYLDLGFAGLFTVEAVIKIIADGFFLTPNAYLRSTWGFIDGIVLITLWINVATSLYGLGSISRAVGAFKALRALRLLSVSDSAKETFHSVIVLGGWKIISAAFVSLSLLIPFAIYGLNLFNGQMLSCNDSQSGIINLVDCVGEYNSSPYNWDVLAPRVVSNSYYSFDDFGSSLFILFQIVSQEGWIDVMWSAESIAGRGMQPQSYASQGNALFFVIFNLLGAVFVLTLFVSVFMRNYAEQTGVAFLTADQRSWLELRKLLRQVSPSKRPSNRPDQKWKYWCYRLAVKKHGRWQRFVAWVLFIHLVLLMTEYFPEPSWWQLARDYVFFAFTLLYIANIVIRINGLTWTRFRKSSWDVYSLLSVSGSFITTILVLADNQQRVYLQMNKLFLVSITLLLIPRNDQLDQLFKTAAASLPAISNLMATWFVLFLAYAIAMTQTFGLTRFGENEDGNVNFRTVPKALILLFRMSCGEGWNAIMQDFASIKQPYCVDSSDFFSTDCGSETWAQVLFVSWNLLSMYIFVSLFVSLIYESFSYVYQRSNGLSVISREEIRRFKQAWATFDPDGTGFITKESFPRLLGELSGVFEMRIYDGEFTIGRLLEDCTVPPKSSIVPNSRVVEGVDLDKLSRRVSRIPVHEIRRRKQRMNTFYEEVLVSADPDRGISFSSILMILAHYNVINDNKSLRLEEYLRRRARLQRVEEQVRRNVVIGFFDTLYWSRRFRRAVEMKRSGRLNGVPQLAVPEIFVDEGDELDKSQPSLQHRQSAASLSPIETTDFASRNPFAGSQSRPISASSRPGSTASSPTRAGDVSPQLSPFRPSFSDAGYGSDGAPHARKSSNVSAQDVLEVLDNSAWGESIRRSFTLRRPQRSRRPDDV